MLAFLAAIFFLLSSCKKQPPVTETEHYWSVSPQTSCESLWPSNSVFTSDLCENTVWGERDSEKDFHFNKCGSWKKKTFGFYSSSFSCLESYQVWIQILSDTLEFTYEGRYCYHIQDGKVDSKNLGNLELTEAFNQFWNSQYLDFLLCVI